MDDRVSGSRELALAAVGAVALTAERIDALADVIAARGGVASREEARTVLREQVEHWREEALKVSGHALSWTSAVTRELGLATHAEMDELELRVAQIEHRLQLLERSSDHA